jgi:hypothetical protein
MSLPRNIPAPPPYVEALDDVDGLFNITGCCMCSRSFLYDEKSFNFRFRGFLQFDEFDERIGLNPLFACADCEDMLPGVGPLPASEAWTRVDETTDLTGTDLDKRYGIKTLYDLRVEICTTRPGSYASDDECLPRGYWTPNQAILPAIMNHGGFTVNNFFSQ